MKAVDFPGVQQTFPGMLEKFLLVDYENVRDLTLSRLPDEWRVRIFIGRSQNSVPFALAQDAQALGTRLEWIKIEGDGHNNLDFHLGALANTHPFASFAILSKDKGFDALVAHIVKRGTDCRRIDEFKAIASPGPDAGDPHFTRAYEVLAKIEKKSRPRRRKTLQQQVTSVFQKKLSEAEVQRVVEKFFGEGLVTESNGALTYAF